MKIHSFLLNTVAVAGLLTTAFTTTQAAVVTTDLGFATTGATDTAAQDAAAWLAQKGSPWIDSSTNLLQSSTVTVLNWGNAGAASIARFHDGQLATPTNGNTANLSLFNSSVSLQFNLGGFYDIGKIETFTNWDGNQRVGQAYTIFTSINGGSSWTSLYSVNFGNVASGSNVIRGVSTADSTPGTAIATGVNAIRIDIHDFTGSANNAVYAEIAAYAVPEPSSLALLAVGAFIGLLGLARRGKLSRSAS